MSDRDRTIRVKLRELREAADMCQRLGQTAHAALLRARARALEHKQNGGQR